MNTWMDDNNWRKKSESQNIYFMRNHNYAFAAWEIERIKGTLRKNEVLVHVDAHLDDVTEAVAIPGILDEILTVEESLKLAKPFDRSSGKMPEHPYMRIDNFIWPAIARNTIGDVYYISHDSQIELNEHVLNEQVKRSFEDFNRIDVRNDSISEFLLNNLKDNEKTICRYKFIEDQQKDKDIFLKNIINKKTVLDIDLDYFNNSQSYNIATNLMSEEIIRKNLKYLKDLTSWDVVTVALSPEYCGGERACHYLLEIFMEIFKVKESDLINW